MVCYLIYSETTGKEQFDHPYFENIIKSLDEYNGIKHSSYRIAFKIFALQRELRGKIIFVYKLQTE